MRIVATIGLFVLLLAIIWPWIVNASRRWADKNQPTSSTCCREDETECGVGAADAVPSDPVIESKD